MNRLRPVGRDTDYLLPPAAQDWLPGSHSARYVVMSATKWTFRSFRTRTCQSKRAHRSASRESKPHIGPG